MILGNQNRLYRYTISDYRLTEDYMIITDKCRIVLRTIYIGLEDDENEFRQDFENTLLAIYPTELRNVYSSFKSKLGNSALNKKMLLAENLADAQYTYYMGNLDMEESNYATRVKSIGPEVYGHEFYSNLLQINWELFKLMMTDPDTARRNAIDILRPSQANPNVARGIWTLQNDVELFDRRIFWDKLFEVSVCNISDYFPRFFSLGEYEWIAYL